MYADKDEDTVDIDTFVSFVADLPCEVAAGPGGRQTVYDTMTLSNITQELLDQFDDPDVVRKGGEDIKLPEAPGDGRPSPKEVRQVASTHVPCTNPLLRMLHICFVSRCRWTNRVFSLVSSRGDHLLR